MYAIICNTDQYCTTFTGYTSITATPSMSLLAHPRGSCVVCILMAGCCASRARRAANVAAARFGVKSLSPAAACCSQNLGLCICVFRMMLLASYFPSAAFQWVYKWQYANPSPQYTGLKTTVMSGIGIIMTFVHRSLWHPWQNQDSITNARIGSGMFWRVRMCLGSQRRKAPTRYLCCAFFDTTIVWLFLYNNVCVILRACRSCCSLSQRSPLLTLAIRISSIMESPSTDRFRTKKAETVIPLDAWALFSRTQGNCGGSTFGILIICPEKQWHKQSQASEN